MRYFFIMFAVVSREGDVDRNKMRWDRRALAHVVSLTGDMDKTTKAICQLTGWDTYGADSNVSGKTGCHPGMRLEYSHPHRQEKGADAWHLLLLESVFSGIFSSSRAQPQTSCDA